MDYDRSSVKAIFGRRLKELREKHNLTQEELAKNIKKSRSTIAGYETESKEPDFKTLVLLARYFKVSTDWLLGEDESKEQTNITAGKIISLEYGVDILNIAKASKKMSNKDKEKMISLLKIVFPEYFSSKD